MECLVYPSLLKKKCDIYDVKKFFKFIDLTSKKVLGENQGSLSVLLN